MKAVLLAAGQSKRMAPLSDKNFLPICGQPLIAHQFEQLRRCGFKDVIVVGGRHNLAELKKIADVESGHASHRDHDGRGRDGWDEPRKGRGNNILKITIVEQKNLSDGMAGAVLSAEAHLQNQPFLVLSSNDVIEDYALEKLLTAGNRGGNGHGDETTKCIRHNGSDSGNSQSNIHAGVFLLAKKVASYFPGGYLKIDRKNRVQKIVEKPGAGKEPSELVNIVAHVHREPEKFFQALKKTKTGRDDRYEVALDSLIRSGVTIMAVPYDGIWQAIKYPWHLLHVWKILFEREISGGFGRSLSGLGSGHQRRLGHDAQQLARRELGRKNARIAIQRLQKTVISKTAIIRGDVIIEDGVKIFDHAVIQGPTYIGKNSVIANNALVRESHIGAHSVIGFSTEIARSYLCDNVWTHTNYIGDSVIGANTSFGSGAVTANLRLDEGNIFVNAGCATSDRSPSSGDGDEDICAGEGAGSPEGVGMSDQRVDTGTNKFGIITGENVRVGVNTSIMPGVKIGNNSFVTSGLCISEDIGDGQFVYGRWTLEKRPNRIKLQSSAREEMMKKLRKS